MQQVDSFKLIDQPEFRPLYVSPETSTVQFSVPDAKCAKCLGRIEGSVETLPGVQSARLDLGRKILTVRGQANTAFAPVIEVLERAGYAAEPIKTAHSEEHLRRRLRTEYLRLGVTAACAGNIMLLAISQYAGANRTEFDLGFGWISFGLFLPVLLFGAVPFWRSLRDHLRVRRLSIDAPVVAALTVGTVFSLKNLLTGSGETYFDSLSALIFLLLAARAWQDHIQRKISQSLNRISFLDVFSVRRWNTSLSTYQVIPPEKLSVGDKIILSSGERLPADARLVSPNADLNCAVWTGESEPQIMVQGQLAFAGSRLVGGQAEFLVTAVGDKSRLGELLHQLRSTRSERGQFQSLVNKVGEYFAILVLAIAAIYVLLFAWTSPLLALERALALTLLACPCALAIATPLALSRALEAAQRLGLIIKNGDSLEKLERVQNVIFDKTGTLTWGDARVIKCVPEQFSEEVHRAIYLLEKDSLHPYGVALARHFAQSLNQVGQMENFVTKADGVAGRVDGKSYQITKCLPPNGDETSPWTWIGIWQENQLMGQMALTDPIRQEARAIVRKLQQMGKAVYLLTGDRKLVADHVAQELSIPLKNVQGECKPEDKLAAVKNLTGTLMVGDGVNDTLAMAAADVSVAVRGGMEASLKTSDVYLSQTNLNGLIALLELGHQTRSTIRKNLLVSLTYNISGGTLALMGYIHPLLAAVLMPVSSFTLVILTLLSFRQNRTQPPLTKESLA